MEKLEWIPCDICGNKPSLEIEFNYDFKSKPRKILLGTMRVCSGHKPINQDENDKLYSYASQAGFINEKLLDEAYQDIVEDKPEGG